MSDDENDVNPEAGWEHLISSYRSTIRCTAGTGARGQGYVDRAYEDLKNYAEKHPDFKDALPRKHGTYDDGFSGAYEGIAAFGRAFRG